MAKEHGKRTETWGTLEELLLACAVNRHGTTSWDSIAMEVQNRTSIFPSLTSQHCIEKFNDLKHRFKPLNDASASLVPIIDELRKIRVEELRREVQRRDVSILSLELKVKKLEEERDKSAKEETDLVREKRFSQDTVAGKTAAGEESGDERDNRSFNESNSTDQPKAEATTATVQNDAVDGEAALQPDPQIKMEHEPDRSGSDPRSGRDWSCNGKSEDFDDDDNDKAETDKKETGIKTSHTMVGLVESNELGESVGESKREEKEKEKQNSDVQSSANLSLKAKKRRYRGCSGGGSGARVGSSSGESGGGSGLGMASSSGEERREGGGEVFPATKRVKAAVKSELMYKLIGAIRSHRLGSVFEQRLRGQESQRYKNLIRQHIDLQTIQSRLDKGVYSSSIQKFFRDLLLLFSNGIVFFKKNSAENRAACQLRAQVLKEMAKKLGTRKLQTVKPEPETKQQATSFSKPNKSSSTIVARGKGYSAKAAAVVSETASKKDSGGDKKDKQAGEEKPKINVKKIEASSTKIEDKSSAIRKKRTKDRSVTSNKNSNTSYENAETKHKYGGNELSSHDALEMKVERKGNNNMTTSKRQGAASFLKRMKQNSLSQVTGNEEESSEEEQKEKEEVDESKGKKEKVKKGGRNKNTNSNSNREGITERVTRSSKGRNAKQESGRGKRTVGRPPKKDSPVEQASTGKRGRDNGDPDVGVGGGKARKRSRR